MRTRLNGAGKKLTKYGVEFPPQTAANMHPVTTRPLPQGAPVTALHPRVSGYTHSYGSRLPDVSHCGTHMLQRLTPSLPSLPPLRNSSADGGLRSSLFLQCAKRFLEDKLGNDKYSDSEDTWVALKKVTDDWRWQKSELGQSGVLVLNG